jgi:hypothetical protein
MYVSGNLGVYRDISAVRSCFETIPCHICAPKSPAQLKLTSDIISAMLCSKNITTLKPPQASQIYNLHGPSLPAAAKNCEQVNPRNGLPLHRSVVLYSKKNLNIKARNQF